MFLVVAEALWVFDADGIEAAYTWRADADFYRGDFPGNPVTPGVLLVGFLAERLGAVTELSLTSCTGLAALIVLVALRPGLLRALPPGAPREDAH